MEDKTFELLREAAADLALQADECIGSEKNGTNRLATAGRKEVDVERECEAETGLTVTDRSTKSWSASEAEKDNVTPLKDTDIESKRSTGSAKQESIVTEDRSADGIVGAFPVTPSAANGSLPVTQRGVAQEPSAQNMTRQPLHDPPLWYQASAMTQEQAEHGDALIEAHLVEEQGEVKRDEEKGELVVAEQLKKSKKSCIVAGMAAVIAGMSIILVVMLALRKEGSSNAESPTTSGNNIPLRGHTDQPSTSNSSDAQKCFENRPELLEAVGAYLDNRSPNSSVVNTYGWPIGSWCVSQIKEFSYVFKNIELQEDIGDWDMTGTRRMEDTFRAVHNMSANWGIQRWDVSQVVQLKAVFMDTDWVEPMLDLSSWDVSQCRSFNELFRRSNVEQPGVKNWDTGSLTNMGHFAEDNNYFNEDLSKWETGSLTTMDNAFRNARNFNQDIGGWDTKNLEVMRNAFLDAKSFNQDLSGWNVSVLTELERAFSGASNFSQNLCAWGSLLPRNANTTDMFSGTACPNTTDPVIPHGPFCFNCI